MSLNLYLNYLIYNLFLNLIFQMESSNYDDLITKKQELLKKEIIDNNLDKDIFLDYCISKKENGDDLDCWTIEELESIINEFKQSLEKSKQSKSNEIINKDIKESKDKESEDLKVEVEKIKVYVRKFT
jgi:hypothetical protein